jgi:hypothetical protein
VLCLETGNFYIGIISSFCAHVSHVSTAKAGTQCALVHICWLKFLGE